MAFPFAVLFVCVYVSAIVVLRLLLLLIVSSIVAFVCIDSDFLFYVISNQGVLCPPTTMYPYNELNFFAFLFWVGGVAVVDAATICGKIGFSCDL